MSTGPTPTPDERIREGLEHLQTAALEMIAAARVFLDLAEDVVRDPSGALAVAAVMAERAGSHRPPADEPRVERIRVS